MLVLTFIVATSIFPHMNSVLPPAARSDVVRALRAAAALVEHSLARALERHGVTTAQYAALQVLADAERGSMGCSEIRTRLTGVAPDVTRLLDRLESAGLVSRLRDTTDRRVVHASLTDRARDLLSAAAEDAEHAEEMALAELSPDQRGQLSTLLHAVQRKCAGRAG